MTQPPPPGQWGAEPPPPRGNWHGHPGGQHGPGPQGPWNPQQQQWPNPTPESHKQGSARRLWKWTLGAAALIAVVTVTAVVAVSCSDGKDSKNGNGGAPASESASASGKASADDTGPVSVITEDRSCAPWTPIATTVANAEGNGWTQLDHTVAASAWTPEMRTQYQAVGEALKSAANEAVPLAELTDHRVMRELYLQYVAYIRYYADRIPEYVAADNEAIRVGSTLGDAITSICQAISFGPAASRAPFISAGAAPEHTGPVGDVQNPTRFLVAVDGQCADWRSIVDQLNADSAYSAWNKEDPSIPASNWSPQYKAENISVMPVLMKFADTYEKLARQNPNPIIQDFGILAAQYGRAFVKAIPTYTQPDANLYDVFRKIPAAIVTACKALGGS